MVCVTECNDVTKRQGIVITIWRTSAIKVTALSQTQFSEMKGLQEKRIYHGCEGQIEKSFLGIKV